MEQDLFMGVDWRVAKSLGGTGKDGLLGEINRSAPGRLKDMDGAIGDSAHANRTSDHNPCVCHLVVCARDFTHDPEGGFNAHSFADWLALRLKDGQEARVKYVISKARICSGPGQSYRPGIWREYRGSNPHSEHIHISVRHPAAIFDNQDTWDWELKQQKECVC